MRENRVLIYPVIKHNFKHNLHHMKHLLITSNKAETIINVITFVIGSALILTLVTALIYGSLNGSLS